ncbi:MAG: GIY-YIG nuclease family protein [Aureliella sp.]
MIGKTIRLHLVEGDASGIMTTEIIIWTGMILVAPRSQLAELAKREEVRRTGVYILVGPDPEQPTRDAVYTGEGDDVLERLKKHDKDEKKDFWTRCLVVISKDQNITKSHGRYLESRLVSMGHEAGRARIMNDTCPKLPSMPEPDVADMEYFLHQMKIVLPVLGVNYLQPRPVVNRMAGTSEKNSPLFTLNVVGTEAYAREVEDEFIVLKDSTARKEGLPSWTSYKSLREQLIADGKLVLDENSEFYVFTEDVPFNSPSAGGAVVNAGNINGRDAWKVSGTTQTYADWHDRRLLEAEVANE